MPDAKPESPTVYLLHGDDELAMAEFAALIEGKLGESSSLALDIHHFSAAKTDLGELERTCMSVPFLASRRLIVLHDPWAAYGKGQSADRFLKILESLPLSTALVLIVPLDPGGRRRDRPEHPLIAWVQQHPESTFVRAFVKPKGQAFANWVAGRCQELGGAIDAQAAEMLAEYVAEEPLLAHHELCKLLDYVDRKRPVRVEDVERLTPLHGQSNVFAMVDALGRRQTEAAIQLLHQLLEDEPAGMALAMIVRQFRLLLQVRAAMEEGLQAAEVLPGNLKWKAADFSAQARNFSFGQLKQIYRDLLGLDLASKSSRLELEAGLDTFVAALARQTEYQR